MKKYKLIKEYPGSPHLGAIIIYNKGQAAINFFENLVVNQPEFWEEVVEKDYEILSYKSLKEGHILFYNEEYDKNFFHNNNWIIHSVKRLSDGEIFTVGDICKTTKSEHTLLIDEIVIVDDILRFNCGNVKGIHCTLHNELYKIKKPLFITEDGVDIYENDTVYLTYNFQKPYSVKCLEDNNYFNKLHKNFKLFSNKKAAEEYILYNKPCLSINDVLNSQDDTYFLENKLKELVNQKLGKQIN